MNFFLPMAMCLFLWEVLLCVEITSTLLPGAAYGPRPPAPQPVPKKSTRSQGPPTTEATALVR